MLREVLLGAVTLYRWVGSPLLAFAGLRCRHEPTCSNYAAEALRTLPTGHAVRLSAGRVLRCHPWGTHGHDPVPSADAHVASD